MSTLTNPLSLFVKKGQHYIQPKQRLVDGVLEICSYSIFKKISNTECLDIFENTVSLIVGSPPCRVVSEDFLKILIASSQPRSFKINDNVKIYYPGSMYHGRVGTITNILQYSDTPNVWHCIQFEKYPNYSFLKEQLRLEP
jgi:hypothetical protein